MQFNDLNLIDPLLRALRDEGYTTPTPIQTQAIPPLLEGRDLIGCAQTGTGKTAAFALPILQRLMETPARKAGAIRALILAPTRELALQIGESFAAYGRYTGLKAITVFGGVTQHAQVDALRRKPAILVATPGRLLDLHGQGLVRLDNVEMFVLDEMDRMLDMGFVHDVRRVVKIIPAERQTLLFSATVPDSIEEIAASVLTTPVRVAVKPQATPIEVIEQSLYYVDKQDKRALLELILLDGTMERVIVFSRTKHGANRLAEQLSKADVKADAIHGNKSQNARQKALADFKSGRIRVLVATDIAARGIDVDDITHVVNFDLPNVPEDYVHRIGRTARAGASGIAISFCEAEERAYLRDIERLIRRPIPVIEEHPYLPEDWRGLPEKPAFRPDKGQAQRRQENRPKPASSTQFQQGRRNPTKPAAASGTGTSGSSEGRRDGRNGNGSGEGRRDGRNGNGSGEGRRDGRGDYRRDGRSDSQSERRSAQGASTRYEPRRSVPQADLD